MRTKHDLPRVASRHVVGHRHLGHPCRPALWVLFFLLVGGKTGVGETETGGFAAGLGLAVVIAAIGAGLTRVPSPAARGVGVGLLAGGLACALPSLWVLLT